MTSRTNTLRRIARLYGVVEAMHSVALRQATASVREADGAMRREAQVATTAGVAARMALAQGERESWHFAHAEGEIAAMRVGLLDAVKRERVETESMARAEFLGSRIKTEQMKQVVQQRLDQAAVEEGRRMQATSDDRYAARRGWLAGRRAR